MRNPPSSRVAEQVTYLARRDGWECRWCTRPVNKITGTRDHLIPRSAGGRSHVDNYVLSCGLCNSTRGDVDAEVWERACERARTSPECILDNGDLNYDMVPIVALHFTGRAKKIRAPRVVRQRSPESLAARTKKKQKAVAQEVDEKPWQMSPPPIIKERIAEQERSSLEKIRAREAKAKLKRFNPGTVRRIRRDPDPNWRPLGAEHQDDPFMW